MKRACLNCIYWEKEAKENWEDNGKCFGEWSDGSDGKEYTITFKYFSCPFCE